MKTICLIGNPNCGKTTLFNVLTGSFEKVGNWTGVTITAKRGRYKKNKDIEIIDLPGTYSLSAFSKDEQAVIDYLKNTPPDYVINVLDGTNLNRNLKLTCELNKLNIPTCIAVNFYDDLRKNGMTLNTKKMQELFNVPVLEVSALKKINVDLLIKLTVENKESIKVSADDYFSFIDENIDSIITRKQTKSEKITEKLDGVFTDNIIGIPIFAVIITLIYYISITLGGLIGEKIAEAGNNFCITTGSNLLKINCPEVLNSLIVNGVFAGVITVFSILPQILVLFVFLTVLEESGYMSRVAFLLDGLMRKIGLGGKSIIPLVLSCGCSVSGVMASRTIEDINERRLTIILSPFMPCGAKMAVFGWMASVFFNGNPFVATSMYFLGVFSVAFWGVVLKKRLIKSQGSNFILEMPTLRLPLIKTILRVVYEKFKDFSVKAGTVIFAVSILMWVLTNFGLTGYVGSDIENSLLANIGNVIKYVFYPLGFKSWKSSVALITGLLAKEAVVETITLLSINVAELFSSKNTVYAYMSFVLLMPPCVATLGTIKQELNNKKWFAFLICFEFFVAYFTAFIINYCGKIIDSFGCLIFVILVVIMFIVIRIIREAQKQKCSACKGKVCKKNCNKANQN